MSKRNCKVFFKTDKCFKTDGRWNIIPCGFSYCWHDLWSCCEEFDEINNISAHTRKYRFYNTLMLSGNTMFQGMHWRTCVWLHYDEPNLLSCLHYHIHNLLGWNERSNRSFFLVFAIKILSRNLNSRSKHIKRVAYSSFKIIDQQ